MKKVAVILMSCVTLLAFGQENPNTYEMDKNPSTKTKADEKVKSSNIKLDGKTFKITLMEKSRMGNETNPDMKNNSSKENQATNPSSPGTPMTNDQDKMESKNDINQGMQDSYINKSLMLAFNNGKMEISGMGSEMENVMCSYSTTSGEGTLCTFSASCTGSSTDSETKPTSSSSWSGFVDGNKISGSVMFMVNGVSSSYSYTGTKTSSPKEKKTSMLSE